MYLGFFLWTVRVHILLVAIGDQVHFHFMVLGGIEFFVSKQPALCPYIDTQICEEPYEDKVDLGEHEVEANDRHEGSVDGVGLAYEDTCTLGVWDVFCLRVHDDIGEERAQ